MELFVKIIFFLFGGIGTTLVGLVIRQWIRKRQFHSGHLGNKTTLVTDRKREPIVYPPVTLPPPSSLKSSASNSKTNILYDTFIPSAKNIDISDFEDTSAKLHLHISESLGFDSSLTDIALFYDGSLAASTKTDDKFVYGVQDKGIFMYSGHNPDNWDDIEFKKTKDTIRYRKEGSSNNLSDYNVVEDNNATLVNIDEVGLVSGIPGLPSSISSNFFKSKSDDFVYADKEDGIIISSKHDPEKWDIVEFIKTKEEVVYKFRKKKK